MTREELEKAIKNGESLWYIFMKEIFKIEIKKHINQFISRDNEYCYTDEKKVDRCFPIEVLFKTKAEAEHYLHHANVSRTEHLPFLTWEEFKNKERIIFTTPTRFICTLSYLDNILTLSVGKNNECTRRFVWDLTEANFYKAYDEAVRLFKGEE